MNVSRSGRVAQTLPQSAACQRGVRAPIVAIPMAEPIAMCVRESKGADGSECAAILDQGGYARVYEGTR